MMPWATAEQRWEKDCAKDGEFEHALAKHFGRGIVVSTPDLFAMVEDQRDAWFVTSLAAKPRSNYLRRLSEFLGYRPYVRWRRNGGETVKQYRWEQLMRRA